MLVKIQAVPARLKLLMYSLLSLSVVSTAFAQTGADWDIGEVTSTTNTLLGVGVIVTVAMVVFKVGKRAANKV